ncbi:MAG: PDDEXK nuclease domain-containing protein [Bacteriovoracaceae bacterium]
MANLDKAYQEFLGDLKSKIASSRYTAVRAVNTELILLYWDIGNSILQKQETAGWGKKVIQQLSKDLEGAFPDMKGFSERNLDFMRQFAKFWPDPQITKQVVSKLPWGHNILLLQRTSSESDRLWYAQKSLENGWSRNILAMQIESNLKARIGSDDKTNNFAATLPKPQSDLANNTLKDPYIFDFLSIGQEAHEREIEKSLVDHIQKFLLELGSGFAYVGRQVHLDVGGDDFYLDLLFYHIRLHCYVVVELKADKFKPEYAGQLNFYLTAVDKQLKTPEDNPTIGILLCKTKNKVVAEYALKDISKPMGISEYRIGDAIPEKIKTALPSIEELEQELGGKDE